MVPPPSPCTTREIKSSATDPAKAKITYATAESSSPVMIAGRRPYRSEKRPQNGAHASWATENARDQESHDQGVGAEIGGIVGQERQHHRHADHVHEGGDEENRHEAAFPTRPLSGQRRLRGRLATPQMRAISATSGSTGSAPTIWR